MRRSQTRATLLSVLLVIVCGWMVPARADFILNTPAGLLPGDQFRIVFVTTETISTYSGDISVYDSFVQAQAGGASYNGVIVNWLAIGSTSTVNAIDHIGQTDTPVFLVTGTRVTTSTTTSGLWSGGLEHAIDRDIHGASQAQFVWTGTQTNGQKLDDATALGGVAVQVGSSAASDSGWIMSTNVSPSGSPLPRFQVYGISEVLRVPGTPPPPIPEPASAVLLGVGGAMALGLGWARRRGKNA